MNVYSQSVSFGSRIENSTTIYYIQYTLEYSYWNTRNRVKTIQYDIIEVVDDIRERIKIMRYNITEIVGDIRERVEVIQYKISQLVCETKFNICYLFKTYEPPPPQDGSGGNNSSDGGWGGPGGSGEVPDVVWNSVLDVGYLVVMLGISFLPVLIFGRRGLGGTLVLLALYGEAGLIDTWIVALAAILLLGLIFIELRSGGGGSGG